MLTSPVTGDSRLSFWLRVREFAVPPSMIETATARRLAGDWGGACAAAGFDVDLRPRSVARVHGAELAARVRADLRHLAPDLLRWHMPRIAPDGLLRPGVTLTLARYDGNSKRPVHLVVRTPPAWADAGQRISLALWDGSSGSEADGRHPHPPPNRRYRLDLHRHLWDARRADELRVRSGVHDPPVTDPEVLGLLPEGRRCAVNRWAAEAGILLRAEGRSDGRVLVRCGARHRLALDLVANRDGPPALRITRASTAAGASAPAVLPDAATWILPDLELLRTGAIGAERLHPLVAAALVPGHVPNTASTTRDPAGQPRLVECRGVLHRIGLVDEVLAPLDHDPAEVRREELLAALSGTPLPCLRVIDETHRHPECLDDVRERLVHGDVSGALAVVEGLLGPDAVLRGGALRDELEAAARQRIVYGLFRAGMAGPGPGRVRFDEARLRPSARRSHPRLATRG
ncbi:hypothetical protein [Streptomyces sp. NPDC001536]|uniref:hypothetical protein n=1 Tax=Streptomyces sp. NPDC001536 TaxID=3364583 RepID=UPI00369768A7